VVHISAFFLNERGDIPDRLDGADLIIGVHDGHQDRLVGHGGSDIFRMDDTVLIRTDIGHLVIPVSRGSGPLKDGVMLDRRGHDMVPLGGVRPKHAEQREVIRFGPVAVKMISSAWRPKGRDLLARVFHGPLGLTAEGMNARRIPEDLVEKMAASPPRLSDPSACRRIIKIYLFMISPYEAELCLRVTVLD
jgi:hypothetical protein